jgi:hypothetical protein
MSGRFFSFIQSSMLLLLLMLLLVVKQNDLGDLTESGQACCVKSD